MNACNRSMPPREGTDFLTLVAVTSHLMTCYATRPCPVLACKVAQHLRVLLEACGEDLGPWQGAFEKLHGQWVRLAAQPERTPRDGRFFPETKH